MGTIGENYTMSEIIKEFKKQFGEDKVQTIFFKQTENQELANYPFILIDIEMRSPVKVLMTSSLSEYKMPVSEKFIGKEFNELCFCLPSYWDLNETNNTNLNWVFEVLFKYQKHAIEKQTWFGVGHTIPFSNPARSISERMKQSYFFLQEPLFLAEKLTPIELEEKTIHFLMLLPIFEDEFDYKIGKGTFKFQKKLSQHNVTELLDDYRSTVLKTKWRFFGK